MTKHIIDHPKTTDNIRAAQEYTRIDGDDMPRPQTKTLQKRARTNKEGKRLKAFTDIERRSGS